MPKAFNPDRFLKDAQDAVKASETKQGVLQKKVDAAQDRFNKAETALDNAKMALAEEKDRQAVSQAFIDRNSNGPVESDDSGPELPPL